MQSGQLLNVGVLLFKKVWWRGLSKWIKKLSEA